MKGKLLLFFYLTTAIVYGQMLNNLHGEAFTDEPFFNAQNIRANKIKRIIGHYSTKRMNDQIRPSQLIYVYEFDTLGRLVQKYESIQVNGGIDTVVTQYEYQPNGFLKIKRRSDKNGFYTYLFDYDSSGRVIREEFRRSLNKNQDILNFDLDKHYTITFETSSYSNQPGFEKRTYFNSYNKPFKEKISFYDKNGYLTEESEKLKVTSGRKNTTYTYNERGLLREIKTVSTVMGKSITKYTFDYDAIGNLLSKKIYRDSVYATEIQIVYSKSTGLIHAILTRQVSTNFITLLEFDKIEFYGEEMCEKVPADKEHVTTPPAEKKSDTIRKI